MSMIQINPFKSKRCAFCRYWYDPLNSAISPAAPNIGLWAFEMRARKTCLKRNIQKEAGGAACGHYECKLAR